MKQLPWLDIGLKAAAAAAFFFALKYLILGAPLETSAAWSFSMGLAAGCLAYSQYRRGL